MIESIKREDYNKIVFEHFDITNRETLRALNSIIEADQNQILTKLTGRLYGYMIDKVVDIDFGDIPNTKGDISKLDSYDKLVDCTNLLNDLLKEFKQDQKPVNIIREALANIEARAAMFTKAYKLNVELPMVAYNVLTLSVISATSFLISVCVDFIKTPTQDNFDLVLSNTALVRSKDNLLFTNLEKFNKSCSKGDFDKCMDGIIKANANNLMGFDLAVVLSGALIATLILNIIPLLRELIYFFFHARVRVSDYFDTQADLLQMNAYNLENSKEVDKEKRNKIVKKQLKLVDIFRKVSDKVAIDNKQCEKNATKDLRNSKEKLTISDVSDSMPQSADTSSLF